MITVIASIYNSEEYLENYLTYLNNQTLDSFEIIFINSNSTDNSSKLINCYQFREGIIKKIINSDKKISIYEAWNIGVLNSSNEWVMNYNSDDKLFPTALEVYAAYIKKNKDIDVFYSNCFISKDKNHNDLVDIKIWKDANNLDNLFESTCVGPFPLSKKKTLISAGLFDENLTIAGDYEMWVRLNRLKYKFYKIDEFIGTYFLNPSGVSTNSEKEHLKILFMENKLIRSSINNKKFLKRALQSLKRSVRYVYQEIKSL